MILSNSVSLFGDGELVITSGYAKSCAFTVMLVCLWFSFSWSTPTSTRAGRIAQTKRVTKCLPNEVGGQREGRALSTEHLLTNATRRLTLEL